MTHITIDLQSGLGPGEHPIVPPSDCAQFFSIYGPRWDLTGQVAKEGASPIFAGSLTDVWMVKWNGRIACAKAPRYIGGASDTAARDKLRERAHREMSVWCSLSHENVLPFYGFCHELGPTLSFICPWLPHGTASDYLGTHPHADRLQIIFEVAVGLTYLKERGVVHGDLKGRNILISTDTGRPRPLLCDFGTSKAIGVVGFTTTARGSIPWIAKEILSVNELAAVHTYQSDVWSFGMTIYELFTGTEPFNNIQGVFKLMSHISGGGLPIYPGPYSLAALRGLGPELWGIMEKCWRTNPWRRPRIEVLKLSLFAMCHMR